MGKDSFAVAPVVATQVKVVDIYLRIVDAVPAAGEEPAVPKAYIGRYSYDQLASDGTTIVEVREGNLVPHLTPAQVTQIKAFLDAMLTKAKGSV